MKASHFPVSLATAWDEARRAGTRPLTPEEWTVLRTARDQLLQELVPKRFRNGSLLRTAMEALTTENFRMRAGKGQEKAQFGVLTILTRSPLERSNLECRGLLVKVASVLALRGHMGRLLGIERGQMDYFAEEFASHGYLVGRAVLIAGIMLMRVNLYIQGEDDGSRPTPEAGKAWVSMTGGIQQVALFMYSELARERSAIYAQPVQSPKARYMPRGGRRTPFGERDVWRLFFRQTGPRYYDQEHRTIPVSKPRHLAEGTVASTG